RRESHPRILIRGRIHGSRAIAKRSRMNRSDPRALREELADTASQEARGTQARPEASGIRGGAPAPRQNAAMERRSCREMPEAFRVSRQRHFHICRCPLRRNSQTRIPAAGAARRARPGIWARVTLLANKWRKLRRLACAAWRKERAPLGAPSPSSRASGSRGLVPKPRAKSRRENA